MKRLKYWIPLPNLEGATNMGAQIKRMKKLKETKTNRFLAHLLLFNLVYLLYAAFSIVFKKDEKIIGFATDYFDGNIKCLYEEMDNYKGVNGYFVTNSKEELEKLKETDIEVYYCRDIKKIPLFVKTNVWVTDGWSDYIPSYYLSMLIKDLLKKKTKILERHRSKWVDTWHATEALEGVGKGRARMLKYYDIGFVSSEFYKQFYSSKDEGILYKLRVTGFPRTDPLINNSFDKQEIIEELNIPPNKKNILYAPSWGNPAAEEDNKKKLFPFEEDERILEDVDKFCIKNNCTFIIRMHQAWDNQEKEYAEKIIKDIRKTKSIFYLPVKKYPVTEQILSVSDILITDYSSIANDFVLLDRPIIYLDTGISAEIFVFKLQDRGGYIAKDTEDLFGVLQNALDSPEQFREEFKEKRQEFLKKICKYLDGKSTQRCAGEIMKLIESNNFIERDKK